MRTENLYSQETMEKNANVAIKKYLAYLFETKEITEKQFRKFTSRYVVVIKKPSFFGTIWNLYKPYREDKEDFFIVKALDINAKEEDLIDEKDSKK